MEIAALLNSPITPLEAYLEYSRYFLYPTSRSRAKSICHLRMIRISGIGQIVLATEADNNPGASLTNSYEELAGAVERTFWRGKENAPLPECILWLEGCNQKVHTIDQYPIGEIIHQVVMKPSPTHRTNRPPRFIVEGWTPPPDWVLGLLETVFREDREDEE